MGVLRSSPMFKQWHGSWNLHATLLLCSILSHTATFKSAGASAASWAPLSGNETDRLSLLDFKQGIGSDPNGALRSWNDSLHYCRWIGVTCGHRHPDRVTALDLNSLGLRGYISPSVANLTFLMRVNLSDNQLHGVVPPQLAALSRLRYMALRGNALVGEIPSNLSGCSKLEHIILRENMLEGQIPMSLGSLSKLRSLNLYSNNLTGAIPTSLGNLSSNLFRGLELGSNMLTGGIPDTLGRLTSLKFLGLPFNHLSGPVPSAIYNLSNIVILELTENQLSGTVPSDLGTTLPKLTNLVMGGNQLEGNIPNSLSNASSLQTIDFVGNKLTGTIPDNLGVLKDLYEFNVGYNGLQARAPKDWRFLESLTNCTNMREIVLFFNELGGELPSSIVNLSATLEKLVLSKNQISGTIPVGIENLRSLMWLSMGSNQFHGGIPSTLGKLSNLARVDLEENQLSGEIPSEIGNLTVLTELYLYSNNLSGAIPKTFGWCQQLQKLDIYFTALNGPIPGELFNIFTLVQVDLSNNFLEGSLSSKIGGLENLQHLDLSVNRLSGYLPTTLGDCQSIQQLILYDNYFQGAIPSSFSNVKDIQELDLSLNNLTGKIPEFLEDLRYLQRLNLSFNNFIGEVPKDGIFANMSAISLLGNKKICGGIPALQLPTCPSQVEKKRGSSHSLKLIVSVSIAGLCLLLLLCFLTYLYWLTKSKGKASLPSSFEIEYKGISYRDLVKATDGFSHNNLIGRGSFGSVYRGILDGEKMVAVKVFSIERREVIKSFKSECEALRNIRHRNLVKIISVCSSIDFSGNDFKALVFELFTNGSLDKWLYPELEVQMRALDFAQRLCIAVDVATALDYLHNHCHSPIIHCDLKPSNVLLDCDMRAHVGDFGLARFLLRTPRDNLENPSSTIGIKGSIGYVAPEYGWGSPVSTYGDVYSFGILLLELFIAKRPIDNMFKEGMNIQKFVEMALPEQAMDIIDPHMFLQQNEVEQLQSNLNNSGSSSERMQGCFVSLMRVGLNCTKESPQERMTMEVVVREICLVQEVYLGIARSVAS